MLRKMLLLGVGIAVVSTFIVSCGGQQRRPEITVISREESSGTRGAFDELMKITDGKTNMLFNEAIIVSSTDEAASKVEVDRSAIGYTSLGSVTNKVKALSIDGVAPTEENVKNGSYAISRPFVLAKKTALDNPVAADFMSFVNSVEGQAVVARSGYITIDNVPNYTPGNVSGGRITLSGSTSVERVIERLREEYIRLNPNVRVEINYNGSSAGIRDCLNDRSDIAMSSRALKSDELEQLSGVTFALDGIAVVVNQSNEKTNITSENVTRVFKGEVRHWDEI